MSTVRYILIYLNRCVLDQSVDERTLRQALNLSGIKTKLYIQKCSALNGYGFSEGLDKICTELGT
jgi:hypothetical protein